MKALLFIEPKKFSLIETEMPEIKPDEVLVKNRYSGLCGTDIHIYEGEFPADFPLIAGHEFSGVVEKAGKNVTALKKGDHVVINPVINCGNCFYCRKGMENYCINLDVYGSTHNGGFSEYTKVLERNAYLVNEGINLKEAALLEPLSCAVYGTSKLKLGFGGNALIFGIGTMGLLLLQLLKIRGISNITMVDVNDDKFEVAQKLGADNVLINNNELDSNLKKISGNGFEVLIDATGISKVCEQIFNYYTVNSQILLYGVCKPEDEIRLKPYNLYRNDLSIFGAFAFTSDMLISAMKLVKDKKIELESLISHELDLDDFETGLKIMKSGKAIKTVFRFGTAAD